MARQFNGQQKLLEPVIHEGCKRVLYCAEIIARNQWKPMFTMLKMIVGMVESIAWSRDRIPADASRLMFIGTCSPSHNIFSIGSLNEQRFLIAYISCPCVV